MNQGDFYVILGVKRSASSDELKAAFRELVKRHHPDLFSMQAEKERATEKLRQINEAYAVLGNPQRRREYDRKLVEESPGQSPRAQAPRRRRGPGKRKPKAPHPARRLKIQFPWARISKKRVGYALTAGAAAALLIYAFRVEPYWVTGWLLVEKVELSSAASGITKGANNWSSVGEFKSAPECAGALKAHVRADESQGARAVFDERNGMMAITVQLTKPAGHRSEPAAPPLDLPSTPSTDAALAAPFDGSIAAASEASVRRVRNLECRSTRRVEKMSWAQRTLRKMGLGS